MAELLGKIFQTIDLRMFIELKREVGKVKKIMYEQNQTEYGFKGSQIAETF